MAGYYAKRWPRYVYCVPYIYILSKQMAVLLTPCQRKLNNNVKCCLLGGLYLNRVLTTVTMKGGYCSQMFHEWDQIKHQKQIKQYTLPNV